MCLIKTQESKWLGMTFNTQNTILNGLKNLSCSAWIHKVWNKNEQFIFTITLMDHLYTSTRQRSTVQEVDWIEGEGPPGSEKGKTRLLLSADDMVTVAIWRCHVTKLTGGKALGWINDAKTSNHHFWCSLCVKKKKEKEKEKKRKRKIELFIEV